MRRLKKRKETRSERSSFRASEKEMNKIKLKANMYTEGNVNEWLVFAATNHRPHKDDFEKTPQ